MSIAGIINQAQANDLNISTSIRQWLYNSLVVPYNAVMSAGAQLQANGTWVTDANGLGLLEAEPDDFGLYQRVPCVAYTPDFKDPKSPVPTGMGDGANNEWCSVRLCCFPGVQTDVNDGTIQPSQQSLWTLKSLVKNSILRAHVMPIVDHGQALVGGNFPQIGYAEIVNQKVRSMQRVGEMLSSNRLRFDVFFDLRFGVTTTN